MYLKRCWAVMDGLAGNLAAPVLAFSIVSKSVHVAYYCRRIMPGVIGEKGFIWPSCIKWVVTYSINV